MYLLNNMGSRSDSCGIPYSIFCLFDNFPFTLQHCVLFSRYDWTGWPHFWTAKFPELSMRFSLSFPGYFKLFPSATQGRKIRWSAFLLAIMLHMFHFPWVFQVFSTKVQISLSFPWDFDNFSNSLSFPDFPCFPCLWPPCWKPQWTLRCLLVGLQNVSTKVLGYSRKYPPPPPMDDIELGTKTFQDVQERQ